MSFLVWTDSITGPRNLFLYSSYTGGALWQDETRREFVFDLSPYYARPRAQRGFLARYIVCVITLLPSLGFSHSSSFLPVIYRLSCPHFRNEHPIHAVVQWLTSQCTRSIRVMGLGHLETVFFCDVPLFQALSCSQDDRYSRFERNPGGENTPSTNSWVLSLRRPHHTCTYVPLHKPIDARIPHVEGDVHRVHIFHSTLPQSVPNSAWGKGITR